MTSPSIATLTADASFGLELMADLSAFFQSSFHVSDFLTQAQCGSVSPYSNGPGRRLLSVHHSFHSMQSGYTATVKVYVVGTLNATRWAAALASSIAAFGFTGPQSAAVVPSGQPVTVTIPCDASTSVAVGSNCSSVIRSPSPASSDGSSLSAGAVAGVVIGAVIGAFLICCVLVALMKEGAKREDEMLQAQQSRQQPPAHLHLSAAPTQVDGRFILYHTPTPPALATAFESASAAELYDEVMTPHQVREEETKTSSPPPRSTEVSRQGHVSISTHSTTQRRATTGTPRMAAPTFTAAAADDDLLDEELSAVGRPESAAQPEPLHVV